MVQIIETPQGSGEMPSVDVADSFDVKETMTGPDSFEALEKNYEKEEGIKELLSGVSGYIEQKLDKDFNLEEKDLIKISLLHSGLENLDIKKIGEDVVSKLLDPLKNILDSSTVENPSESEVTGKLLTLTSAFDAVGLGGFIKKLNKKIDIINQEKQDSHAIFGTNAIAGVIDLDATSKAAMYNSVKGQLDLFKPIISSGKEAGDDIIASLEGFPYGKEIISWLSKIAESNEIVGFLLGIFLGKDFLDEGNTAMKDSINHLKTYISESSSLRSNISATDLEALNSTQLEDFYLFLDNRPVEKGKDKIDYTRDVFWKDLLTGSSNNTEINTLHGLLLGDNTSILNNNEGIDTLIQKLNGLEKQDKQQAQDNRSNSIAQEKNESEKLLKRIQAQEEKGEGDSNTEPSSGPDLKELRTEYINNIAILHEKELVHSIKNLDKIPGQILYKGESVTVDIKNNQLKLGETFYNVQLLYTGTALDNGSDLFQNMSFSGGKLRLTTTYGGGFLKMSEKTHIVNSNRLVNIFKGLLLEETYGAPVDGVEVNIAINKV